MIRINFKKPQSFEIDFQGGFICNHLFAHSIQRHPKKNFCVIRLEDYETNPNAVLFLGTSKNNIQSIERVKPTDL